MDGRWVYTYLIRYRFTTEKMKEVKSFYEIQGNEYNSYFDKRLKVNDIISVVYYPENPEINKIKKME